jgi:2-oxoglutarate/2-oxoacid ferredoxin oxidoreductase subunit beta
MTHATPNDPTPELHVNPLEDWLRMDRIPHIWCPGCGIGTAVNGFIRAVQKSGIPREKIAIVSGIGCTGRVAGYVKLDSFHTTHGRAIPFATGLKLANPELTVVVFSGDGDLIAIGGNHFIHAARRNVNLKVICVNNFTYGMTGGQVAPTSPENSLATTTPYGNLEPPFNLAQLADSCGASYVARWTTYHVRPMMNSMLEALKKPGFSFIEVLTPCPTLFGRRNRIGDGLDMQKLFKEKGVRKDGEPTASAVLDLVNGPIVIGKFKDQARPSFLQQYNETMTKAIGLDKFKPFGPVTMVDPEDCGD